MRTEKRRPASKSAVNPDPGRTAARILGQTNRYNLVRASTLTCRGMFGIQINFCGSDNIACSTIQNNGGYLSLSYPARGISAMGCLIEIDIKIKGKDVDKDLSIIDGSVKAFGQFDSRTANHVDNVNGKIIFKTYVVRKGVEATIDLEFVEVPIGGFNVRMRGKTVRGKAVYSFITECCDDDSFIASPGKHNKKFVAAVSIGDTLCVDFMEKRREALSFVSSKHGNEQQPYRFSNGALVFVKVYWSTIVEG
ncbi:hypothetical protein VPH35_055489 [Triticum aestivum]|uniref:uncharacterized protein n=1 Tax=Triticum aestivum TaxID=4565 RepID=UPI001D016CE3|nr:uncharacterized protein LOC123175858 [Triticum aestivum]